MVNNKIKIVKIYFNDRFGIKDGSSGLDFCSFDQEKIDAYIDRNKLKTGDYSIIELPVS